MCVCKAEVGSAAVSSLKRWQFVVAPGGDYIAAISLGAVIEESAQWPVLIRGMNPIPSLLR